MLAFALTAPVLTAAAIAASGPTALATSLAPWAKLRRAAEQINGIVNSVLILSFVFSSDVTPRAIRFRIRRCTALPATMPITTAVTRLTFQIFPSPLRTR